MCSPMPDGDPTADPCGHSWGGWLFARLRRHTHHCVRPFGHDLNPRRAMHRCQCGHIELTSADIQAGARQLYGLRDDRDQ